MSKIETYRLPQVISLFVETTGSTMYNYAVNQTNIRIFRNCRTLIQVLIKDTDRKPVSLPSGILPVIQFFDTNGTIYLTKNLSLVDAVQGLWSFYVEEMDLPDWSAGSLNYFISINENVQNSTKILYSGTVKTKTLSLTVGQSFSMNATSVVGTIPGLTFANNVFSGTPTTPGTYSITINGIAYSGYILPASNSISLVGTLGALKLGQAASITLGNSALTYSIWDGALPAGLALANGIVSGTPTQLGNYDVLIGATDGTNYGYVSISGTVSSNIVISPSSLPPMILNSSIGATTINAFGGIAPYTYSISSGSLPAGLSLTGSGILYGAPTATGPYSFTLSIADSKGTLSAITYSGSIGEGALTLSNSPTNMDFTVGDGVAYNLDSSGGRSPYTYAIVAGALPTGVSLSNGIISGTPTNAGSYSFVLQIRDSADTIPITTPLYTDRNYSTNGVVYVDYGAIPPISAGATITSFTSRSSYFYSSALAGPSPANPSTQQTAAFYQTNFSGTIIVQASMDGQPSNDDTGWIDVETYNANGITGTNAISFIGQYKWVRFKISYTIGGNAGSVDKIVYRC